MKVTTKGQVTIPAKVRDFLHIEPHDEVSFTVEGDQVILKKASPPTGENRFQKLLGCRKTGHSTEQLMREIRPYAFTNDDPGLRDPK